MSSDLNEDDIQKIKQMLDFIERVGDEQVQMKDDEAKREAEAEKKRLVEEQERKIIDYYAHREKQVELFRKIRNSNMLSQARLKVLRAGEDHISSVLEEAKRRLGDITRDKDRYKALLNKMVLQALLQLLEPEVTVQCRPQDSSLLDLDATAKQFTEITGRKVQLSLETSLPSEACGGVELYVKRGKIRVCNTLESRLDMIALQLVPQIRAALFGRNPNRRFMD